MKLTPIGYLQSDNATFEIEILPDFREGLNGLSCFSHLQVIFGFHESKKCTPRDLQCTSPYLNGPREIGVFATRSPLRPNPIGLTVCQLLNIDHVQGKITVAYHDAYPGSPVFDLKPYTPSIDRVENPQTPPWATHWPSSLEESAKFDWSRVFASDDS